MPVLARINKESIPGRKRAAGICHLVRIELLQGKLTVVEIISPVQNTDNLILIKLQSINSVSEGRHGHEAVAHLVKLSHAIVGPHVCQAMFQEFFNLIIPRNRLVHQTVLVEFVTGKSVEGMEPVQQSLDRFLGRPITLQMFFSWLVGKVKVCYLVNSPLS